MPLSRKEKRVYEKSGTDERAQLYEAKITNAFASAMNPAVTKAIIAGRDIAYKGLVNTYLVDIDSYPEGSAEWINAVRKLLSELRLKSIELTKKENVEDGLQ